MTPALEKWFQQFRSHLPPIKLGSVRLRVAPDGTKGVWLDFANTDIKFLLEEKNWLSELQSMALVEIGQKKKRLKQEGEKLKLGEPELFGWSETYSPSIPIPIYNVIGGFTQSGPAANRVLANTLLEFTRNTVSSWTELGAGAGTLTLPLLSQGYPVTVFETDTLALEGLRRSADEMGLSKNLKIFETRFDKVSHELLEAFSNNEGILADPPRSGLGRALEALAQIPKPELPGIFVYVSCWRESFLKDLQILVQLGYKAEKVLGMDQFPHTPHCEWITVLRHN